RMLGPLWRLVGNFSDRLPLALRANAHVHHKQLSALTGRLSRQLLSTRLLRAKERVATLAERGKRAGAIYLARRHDRLGALDKLLKAFSYRDVLERGFALVRDLEGAPLRSAAALAPGLKFEVEFYDGRVGAVADGPKDATPSPKPSKPRGPGGGGNPGQGRLFGS
ncbi:MAG: exodeoxyribonuclease VII large subunit, partial [Pseudorhodoplanes sp.]